MDSFVLVGPSYPQIQKEVAIRPVEKILRHGIPCVVMSNYPVLDASSDVFFTHLYTKLKSGESVGAAVRHSMLEMKNVDLDQWTSFSVFGDPTLRLPEEMLGNPENLRDGWETASEGSEEVDDASYNGYPTGSDGKVATTSENNEEHFEDALTEEELRAVSGI